MDVVLLLQRTECRTHLPPFRYQPTDLLSLETKIRSPRPDHPGRAFAPAAPGTQTHLVGGTGRTGAGSAQAVSALGKDKLVVLLRKKQCTVSTSMVGRILVQLKRRGALHEPPKPAVLRQARRKLRNRPWAIRKPKHWRIEQPGDLVEIDTKEIRMHRGVLLKHFSARDDGGSEFAAEFEEACQQKQLPLFVLPPKSPKLNGHVERSHRTHNEEFYQVHAQSDQVPVRNRQLRRWEKTYNCVRPHQSLAYLTPLEFITRWKHNLRKAKCH